MGKDIIRQTAKLIGVSGKRGPLQAAAYEKLAAHAHKTGNATLMKQVQQAKVLKPSK